MVTAEADVILLQLDCPERGVELSVLVLSVGINPSHKAQEQQHHQDDDSQDDDVELSPGYLGQSSCGVVSRTAQAGLKGLGGGRYQECAGIGGWTGAG